MARNGGLLLLFCKGHLYLKPFEWFQRLMDPGQSKIIIILGDTFSAFIRTISRKTSA